MHILLFPELLPYHKPAKHPMFFHFDEKWFCDLWILPILFCQGAGLFCSFFHPPGFCITSALTYFGLSFSSLTSPKNFQGLLDMNFASWKNFYFYHHMTRKIFMADFGLKHTRKVNWILTKVFADPLFCKIFFY